MVLRNKWKLMEYGDIIMLIRVMLSSRGEISMTKAVKNKVKNGQLVDVDISLFHKGMNYNSYRFMGAH